ncbi:MAG: ABC transporter permease [Verrucomicrobiota bacterium]
MAWYLYAALKQIFPSRRLLSFAALISIIGVALGVAVLLIVQSVMNGFVNDIRSSLEKTNGDIRIHSTGLIGNWREVVAELEEKEEVASAAPFAEGVVMIQAINRPLFPYVWGLEMEKGPSVLPVEEFLMEGALEDLDDRSVFLSSGVAWQLGASVGSEVDVYTPLMLDRMKDDEIILPIGLRVAGVFETGWNEVDGNTILVTLRTMQELYGLGESVHGITLELAEGTDSQPFAATLNAEMADHLFARTWMDMNEDFLFVLRLEKTMLFFIMIFIVLVASFSIAVSLMMSVIRKTREIGLLSAMGATRFQIGVCFCLQGFLIGTVGTVLGVLGALGCLRYREWILATFAEMTGRGQALIDAYGFSYIPVHYIVSDFVIVTVFSMAVSTLAGLIPAWRASRLQPADALRSE